MDPAERVLLTFLATAQRRGVHLSVEQIVDAMVAHFFPDEDDDTVERIRLMLRPKVEASIVMWETPSAM